MKPHDFTLGTMYWLNPKYGPEEFDEDCRRMVENGYTLIRIIVWWELVEERQGEYRFRFVDDFFAAAARHGLKVMCTVGFYPPFWLTCKLDELGKNDPGRYPSLERPEVREPLALLIAALVGRYRHAPALASWNIWNEPTLNTTRNRPFLEKFALWLKRKYPTYEVLEENWRGEYPVLGLLLPGSLEELDADWLERVFRLGTRGRTSAIEYDFQSFAPELLCEEAAWLCEEIRRHDTEHPTHTNLHSINNNPVPAGRDFYKTARVPDSISSSMHQSNDNWHHAPDLRNRRNFYNCGVDRTWSWLKGGDAMVGELQVGTSNIHLQKYTPTPETVFYELWQSYAAGLRGVIHWEWQAWRGGTFEPGEFGLRAPADGGETPRSRAVANFSRLFEANREVLLKVRREPAKIAILDSFSTSIYRYLQWLDHPGVPGVMSDYQDALLGCYRALNEANLPVEFVSEEEVAAGALSRYRVLYLPLVSLVAPATARGIADFVRNGGAAWADGRFAWLDEHMYVRHAIPGNGLEQVFGVREQDYLAMPEEVSAEIVDGNTVAGRQMRQEFELLGGTNSRIHARYSDGAAAAVDCRYGEGRTRIWGLELTRVLHDRYDRGTEGEVVGFALAAGVAPALELPEGVSGKLLRGEGGDVAVLGCYAVEPVSFRLPIRGRARALCAPAEQTGGFLPLTLAPGGTEVVILQ